MTRLYHDEAHDAYCPTCGVRLTPANTRENPEGPGIVSLSCPDHPEGTDATD